MQISNFCLPLPPSAKRRPISVMQKLTLLFLCIILAAGRLLAASPEQPDSVLQSELSGAYGFRPARLIAPGAMLAAGITGVYAFKGLKTSIQHDIAGRGTDVDNIIQYAPAAAYVGLGFIPGVKTRSDDWRDRIMAGITAYAIMSVVNNVMKVSFREPRPDTGARNSFPSGHSATAFTGAELMRIEYGNLVGTAGYAAAIAVGALRIYNNRHWVNDILGGAAIGILSARAAYWLLPLERKLFRLDKKKSAADIVVLPMAGQANGIALAVNF